MFHPRVNVAASRPFGAEAVVLGCVGNYEGYLRLKTVGMRLGGIDIRNRRFEIDPNSETARVFGACHGV
eukprot:1387799-Amorphochlora_amoeboformis.AAC.1